MGSSSLAAWSARCLDLGRQVARGVIGLIYPPTCHLCGQPLPPENRDLCQSCIHRLMEDYHATCPRCAMTVGAYSNLEEGCPRCRGESLHFDASLRLGLYQDRLREAILRMKSASGEDLAEAIGWLWARQAYPRLQQVAADVVIPVPLHWLRRWQRGYNQAETLARALAGKLGVPCRSNWLWRRRHTPHQTGQPRARRVENVRGAFRAAKRAGLDRKTVLLVDDVMTTGSTCNEVARVLKKAGAVRVVVAVLARSADT